MLSDVSIEVSTRLFAPVPGISDLLPSSRQPTFLHILNLTQEGGDKLAMQQSGFV